MSCLPKTHTAEKSSQNHFEDEDIVELVELGKVLKKIRSRLVAEGKMPDTNR